MRNFSAVCCPQFVSYQINDEYFSSVNVADVVRALAVAFQTPLERVETEYLHLVQNGEVLGSIAFSECAVLNDLQQFATLVRKLESGRSDPSLRDTVVFCYHNLNTGASVSWVHMVE